MLTMPVLASLARIVVQALQSFVSGLRWLARQAYRQRSLGVASNPQLTRLLDVHFVTVAAHLTLLAALIVASPSPTARDWLLSLLLLILLTAAGIWRPTRPVIGLLLTGQLVLYVIAAAVARQGILLALVFALAVAQQAAVIRSAGAKLGRATAAGLALGVLTGGAGLILGLLVPAVPLWICAILLAVAIVFALRLPAPPPRPTLPAQPTRRPSAPKTVPEGYSIYRPSSLDDPPPPR